MKNFIKEFKSFAMKGNVMDLAIGVIIGAAFGKIITSLVDNILMPILGALAGGKNFDGFTFQFGEATIKYGTFLTAVLDFILIALVLFIMIKLMNRLIKKRDENKKAEEKSAEIKLLEEIRDLLRKE